MKRMVFLIVAGFLAVSCEKRAGETGLAEDLIPELERIQAESDLSNEQMVNLLSRWCELNSLMQQMEHPPALFGGSELTIHDLEEFIEISRKTVEDFSEDMNTVAFNSFVVLVQLNEGNIEEGKDMLRREVAKGYSIQQREADSSFVGAVDKVAERDPRLRAILNGDVE